MRIVLVTIGSRGDVQPYVALGIGLKAAGHPVCVATHATFETLIRGHGLEFSCIEGNPRETVESDIGQKWLQTGSNTLAFARRMQQLMQPMMIRAVTDCLNACRGADLVLYSVLGGVGALGVVEKLGVPGLAAYLQPAHPTRSFPSLSSLIQVNFPGPLNRLSYWMAEHVFWSLFRPSINAARRAVLDLPPMPRRPPYAAWRRAPLPVLYGYSPTVLPKPPDWPDQVQVTGYWFLEEPGAWTPPPELTEFLESGTPPVYVGFGSMHDRSAARLTQIVVDALARAGRRGILLSGWGALSHTSLPDHMFPVESVPHQWLFPRVAAVVHHAGAGTTAAGFRAGVPTVAVPFFGDQPFWARRVSALGVGPRPVPVKRLSVTRLAEAIETAACDEGIRARAAAVGEKIRTEDGVARAVEVVEEFARARGRRT